MSKKKRLLIQVQGSDLAPAELPRTGMMVVGSSSEKAGLCVQGQGVADVHCAIGMTKGGGYAIKDLGSEYGTLLNGAKVAQSRLDLGDEILVGSVRMRVVAAEAESSAKRADIRSDDARTSPTSAKSSASSSSSRESKPKPARKRRGAELPQINGYRLTERLGRGAMGDVYLAVQESLDREVALKVLSKQHEQDQVFVQSFQAEARSAAALNHPNIVTVHDVGEQLGVHYLTMEYMDRASLEVRVTKEGPLPWTLVLDVLKDAASGLVYAESRGIVHRDIKPANLMQNHTGTTKIADLGLATSIGSEDAGDGQRKIFGTPHFISPEQIKGEKADCRSDLYSLGSTAYRILTGHTPFEGANTREILRAKLTSQPKPIQELAPDVPQSLCRVVERLMKLDPAERYPSASSLLKEIETLRAGGPVHVAAPRSDNGSKKIKMVVGVGLVIVLGVIGFNAFTSGAGPKKPSPLTGGSTNGGGADSASHLPDEGPGEVLPKIEPAPGPAVDNDIQEKLFETAAENALLKLAQRDLTPAERRDELRELAKEFLGTTAATMAAQEADKIDQQIVTTTQQTTARNTQVESMMKSLSAAADLSNPALRPGKSLMAMQAVEGQEALQSDNVFLAERAKLEAQVVSTALSQFALAKQAIDRQAASGEFELMRESLVDLIARCDLPAFEEGKAPPRAEEIENLRLMLTGQLDSIAEIKRDYITEKSRDDRIAIGQGLGGLNGIGAELVRLDFDAALARVEALDQSLTSEEARAWNKALGEQLRRASRAIPLLVSEYSNWRRAKIDDPEDRRGATRDVLSATSKGLVLDDRGTPREVPWSAFGGKTKPLDTLFSKRLVREYEPAEVQSIAALMHFAALTEALNQASEMFTRAGNSTFTQSEASELPGAFVRALSWCQDSDDKARMMRDHEAAQILADALLHGSGGAWTSAVAELEQLFRDYPDTWVVRILSDGQGIHLKR